MPTEKPRFSVILDEDLNEAVERYWHTNKLKSKAAAVSELLTLALSENNALTYDENKVLNAYREAPPVVKCSTYHALRFANDYANKHFSYRMTGNLLSTEIDKPAAMLESDGITYKEYSDVNYPLNSVRVTADAFERRQKLKAELEKEIQKGHPHDADGEKLNS